MSQWLDEFDLRTKTTVRVHNTYPNVKDWADRLDIVCPHNSFNKGNVNIVNRKELYCNYTATLVQKVSLSTQYMQRAGFLCLDKPMHLVGCPTI